MMTQGMTRILVTASTFPRWENDTEPTFVYDLCTYLHGRGLEVDVLAPHTQGAKKYEILGGINVYRYQYFFSGLQKLAYSGGILANLRKNPLNYLLIPFLIVFQTIAYHRRLQSTDYQLIHAHWLIPQGFICALVNSLRGRRAPPLICTAHGGDIYALNNFIFRLIKKWTINRCARLCVVSSAMKKKVAMYGIADEKTSVMPMGVDLESKFRPVSAVVRRENRLIFVGRLVEKKGVSCLLDAMERVVRVIPDVELLITGDGPLRPVLEKQTSALGLNRHVTFYGSVQHHQLPELYSSAAIAVIPSIIAGSGDQEGLGLVIIEAMGCECAVIASSLDGIRDVVDVDTGVFVTPGEVRELAENICFLLNNQEMRLQLAKNGREKALSTFDWGVTGQRYFQVMSEWMKNYLRG